MNKILLKVIRIFYKNLGEIVVLIGLSLFIYTMFTISKLCGLFALSAILFALGLLISKIHNPE